MSEGYWEIMYYDEAGKVHYELLSYSKRMTDKEKDEWIRTHLQYEVDALHYIGYFNDKSESYKNGRCYNRIKQSRR